MADQADNRAIQLHVEGQNWDYWQRVSIRLSMESLSGSFDLEISFDSDQAAPWPIPKGALCQVLAYDQPVIAGYVDSVNPQYSKTDCGLTVSGRDAAADLVDCSAVHNNSEWRNVSVETIVADLIRPFGLSISVEADTGKPVEVFRLAAGERVADAIRRVLRLRGLLCMSQPGKETTGLVLTRTQKQRVATALVRGQNIISASCQSSDSQRHSEYIVVGQGSLNDMGDIPGLISAEGRASDAGVKRYRPLIIEEEEQDTGPSFKDIAEHTARVRAAQSNTYQVAVEGWKHDAGLWLPNTLVSYQDDYMGIKGSDLLISSVDLAFSKQEGETATLTLKSPAAFDQLPVAETELGGLY